MMSILRLDYAKSIEPGCQRVSGSQAARLASYSVIS
jgi:hypothetical protein